MYVIDARNKLNSIQALRRVVMCQYAHYTTCSQYDVFTQHIATRYIVNQALVFFPYASLGMRMIGVRAHIII